MRPIAWPVTGYAVVESVPIEHARLYRVLRNSPPG